MHGVFQNFGGLKGSRLFIEARFDASESLFSQARDGYIPGHVAELRNGFCRTDSPTSSTCIPERTIHNRKGLFKDMLPMRDMMNGKLLRIAKALEFRVVSL